MDYREVLDKAQKRLGNSYARDLVFAALVGTSTHQDADSLFRTLILDEGWQIGEAERVWSAAWESADNRV